MIDTHVHLLDPARHPWPEDSRGYVPRPDETGTLADLLAVMDRHGVSGAVLTAASVYGGDNGSMFEAAARHPGRFRIMAGVGASPDLAGLAAHPDVAGIRLNPTNDAGQRGQAALRPLLREALSQGLIVALQTPPAEALDLLDGAPEGSVVLDHQGRPDLAGGLPALRRLAARPDTWLKLSGGFRTEQASWPDPASLAREAAAAFPPGRLVWGSDWPFINLDGPRPEYGDCLRWAARLTRADLAANARALFWKAP